MEEAHLCAEDGEGGGNQIAVNREELPKLGAVRQLDLATIQPLLGLEVEQLYRDDTAKAQWVSSSQPEQEDKQLDTWMDKALKLKASSYADGDVVEDALEARFTVELRSESGENLTLEVLQEPEDGGWFARSAHTRGLVKLLTGPTSALAEDVENLVEH